MALSAKEKAFIKEYLIDKNGTRSAKAAGYAPKSAHDSASRLLKKPEVQAALEKAWARETRYAEFKLAKIGMTKERWLEELSVIAMADMDDYATIEEVKIKQGKSGSTVNVKTVDPVLTKDRPRGMGRALKKISESKNGIGIELHSKQAALETIGRHMGWVKNDFGVDLPAGAQVVLTMPTNGREAPAPSEAKTENAENTEDAVNTTSKEGIVGDGRI